MTPPSSPSGTPDQRVALVHDWLTGMRGGERALEAICELYPESGRFALLHVRGSASSAITGRGVRTSFLQCFPGARHYYRSLLPLFPTAIEQFDLDDVDLVISTSHCAAKSVVTPGRTRHLCYCFTPMRYAWDQFDAYFGPDRVGTGASHLLRWQLNRLARWDAATASRADRYVAISQYVSSRIRRYYNRTSSVMYPPVDTAYFQPSGAEPEGYLLVVSALVPYKRIDLAIAAASAVGMPLRIVGTGPDLARLQRAAGADVRFLGSLADAEVRSAYQAATAVILPGIEDFGIVPVEAQACGRPVVALGQGGACETVVDGETGVLVDEMTVEALADGINRVREQRFDTAAIRRQAERFSRARFQEGLQREIASLMAQPVGVGA